MKTVEVTAEVGADRRLVVQLPQDIAPGTHRVVLVIDEAPAPLVQSSSLADWPVHDLGCWPEGFSLRREDLYGDDGR